MNLEKLAGFDQGITHGVRETLNLPLIRTFLSKYSMPWPLSELLKLTHGYTMNISGSAIFIEWLSSTENSSIYCCFLNELSTICSFFVFWAQHIQSLGLSKQILGKNLRIWCQFYLKIVHWHKAGTHQQTHGQTLGHPGGLGQALGQWSRKFCHSFCPLTIGPRPDNWRKCYGLGRTNWKLSQ